MPQSSPWQGGRNAAALSHAWMRTRRQYCGRCFSSAATKASFQVQTPKNPTLAHQRPVQGTLELGLPPKRGPDPKVLGVGAVAADGGPPQRGAAPGAGRGAGAGVRRSRRQPRVLHLRGRRHSGAGSAANGTRQRTRGRPSPPVAATQTAHAPRPVCWCRCTPGRGASGPAHVTAAEAAAADSPSLVSHAHAQPLAGPQCHPPIDAHKGAGRQIMHRPHTLAAPAAGEVGHTWVQRRARWAKSLRRLCTHVHLCTSRCPWNRQKDARSGTPARCRRVPGGAVQAGSLLWGGERLTAVSHAGRRLAQCIPPPPLHRIEKA